MEPSNIKRFSVPQRVVAGACAVALIVAVVVFANVRTANAAPDVSQANATGCEITFVASSAPSGFDEVHRCTYSTYFTPKVPIPDARVLIIGGGGGGGTTYYATSGSAITGGGGGGAGGFVEQDNMSEFTAVGNKFYVEIGAGGLSTRVDTDLKYPDSTISVNSRFRGTGNRGGNSGIFVDGTKLNPIITACGGGGGLGTNNGAGYAYTPTNVVGASSGGAESSAIYNGVGTVPVDATSTTLVGGVQAIDVYQAGKGIETNAACPGQGHKGGSGWLRNLPNPAEPGDITYANGTNGNWCANAGGGGAGSPGQWHPSGCNTNYRSGSGGAGKLSDITGTPFCYAGGGGGAGGTSVATGARLGGAYYAPGFSEGTNNGDSCTTAASTGGRGGYGTNGAYGSWVTTGYYGQPGSANTGMGGGAASGINGYQVAYGGIGGSGVVIIRFPWVEPDTDYSANPNCVQITPKMGDVCLKSVTPSTGPLAGGNTILISGSGFPKTDANDYTQDGLIAQYDGINNTGNGDSLHSTTATAWKNLKGTTMLPDGQVCVVAACGTVGVSASNLQWDTNSIYSGAANSAGWVRINKYYNLANYTLEVVASTTAPDITNNGGTVWYGNPESGGFYFGPNNEYPALANAPVGNSNRMFFSQYFTSPSSRYQSAQTFEPIPNDGTIKTYAGNLVSNALQGCLLNVYEDGVLEGTNKIKNTACSIGNPASSTVWGMFANPSGASGGGFIRNLHTYAFRLYNRRLSPGQIENNYKLDQMRFNNVPQILVGNKVCTNMKIVSTRQITCTVPQGDAVGNTNIDFLWNYNGVDKNIRLNNAYYYGQEVAKPNVSSIIANPSTTAKTIDVDVNSNLFLGDDFQYVDVYRAYDDTCGFDMKLWEGSTIAGNPCKAERIKHFERFDNTGNFSFEDDPALLPDGTSASANLEAGRTYYYTAIVNFKNEKLILEPTTSKIGPFR